MSKYFWCSVAVSLCFSLFLVSMFWSYGRPIFFGEETYSALEQPKYLIKHSYNPVFISNKTMQFIKDSYASSYTNEMPICLFGKIYNESLFIEDAIYPIINSRDHSSSNFDDTECMIRANYLGIIHNHPGIDPEYCPWSFSSIDLQYLKNDTIMGITCPPYHQFYFMHPLVDGSFISYEVDI